MQIDERIVRSDPRRRAFRQLESANPSAALEEELHARLPEGRVGDDERAIGRQIEGARVEHAAGLDADADQLARRPVHRGGDRRHHVGATVEDEVVARCRRFARADVFEPAGDVRRQAADRFQGFDDGCAAGSEARSMTMPSAAPALGMRESVRSRLLDGFQNVGRLRQDDFFERRVVGHRRVERGDAADRGVELAEQLAGDASGDLGAETAR